MLAVRWPQEGHAVILLGLTFAWLANTYAGTSITESIEQQQI
jgi:hypothetical protein